MADLRKDIHETRGMLVAFSFGAPGTVLGTIVGVVELPLGNNVPALARMFSATYIGGPMNMVAVADVVLRVDSNQGLNFPTAVVNIRGMQHLNIQYAEQPIAAPDIDNLARLRGPDPTPICADESVFDDKDAMRIVKKGAADFINIKLGKSGRIRTPLRADAIAEAAGRKCMACCFAESRLALSAAVHLTLACLNIVFFDLDSAYDFRGDPAKSGIIHDSAVSGKPRIPDAPHHGASFDET